MARPDLRFATIEPTPIPGNVGGPSPTPVPAPTVTPDPGFNFQPQPPVPVEQWSPTFGNWFTGAGNFGATPLPTPAPASSPAPSQDYTPFTDFGDAWTGDGSSAFNDYWNAVDQYGYGGFGYDPSGNITPWGSFEGSSAVGDAGLAAYDPFAGAAAGASDMDQFYDPFAGAEAGGEGGVATNPFAGATASGETGVTGGVDPQSLSDYWDAVDQYGDGGFGYDAQGNIVPWDDPSAVDTGPPAGPTPTLPVPPSATAGIPSGGTSPASLGGASYMPFGSGGAGFGATTGTNIAWGLGGPSSFASTGAGAPGIIQFGGASLSDITGPPQAGLSGEAFGGDVMPSGRALGPIATRIAPTFRPIFGNWSAGASPDRGLSSAQINQALKAGAGSSAVKPT